jgi:hypothetical protein
MLAMRFIAEQCAEHEPVPEFLESRDLVEMLKETLPHKPEGRDALVARLNRRHARRRCAIEPRYRTLQMPTCYKARMMPTNSTLSN